ncbi:type II toxin-antitoxin system RelE/ParE family toxin [Pseudohongiella nitratireducens]|uniref:type II toxin-antitoxin system RelE/ParE family toxin n=1 Tax=Pseudohongiella nitratireducens TaxID=1768907 RepID=UPI0009EE359D|nr:type II toxin-antitoxin system RelE/ParE family toxin [Pseudohongiella nitratireducens]
MKLIYSRLAVEDIMRLRAHIEEHNPRKAPVVARRLVARIEKLQRFPRLGIPVNRAPSPGTIRDLILDEYIVRYACHSKSIIILRLWHHRENRT